MADDQDQPPARRPPDDPAATAALPGAAAPRPDETAPMPRPDETAALPRPDAGRPAGPDATAAMPRADETAPLPGAGVTAPLPGAGATAAMPPVDATAQQAPADAVWAGRATVRPPEATAVRGPAPVGWQEVPGWEVGDERSGRSWWLPIVVGIVALLLLGVLGYAVWLMTQADGDQPAAPVPSAASPSPTRSVSKAPTSAAPTSASPTPTRDEPRDVQLPALVGLSVEQAQDTLDGLELRSRVVYRTSDAPAGTVIETDPAEGSEVPAGTRVTLVVAAEPRATPTRPADPTPTGVTPSR